MIVYNSIVCNHCLDVIVSRHRHHYVTCKCGRVAVDGGLDYLKRSYVEPYDYYELSVDSEQPFEIVRLFTMAGEKGLFDLTNEELQARLDAVPHGRHWRLLLEEKLYRAERE